MATLTHLDSAGTRPVPQASLRPNGRPHEASAKLSPAGANTYGQGIHAAVWSISRDVFTNCGSDTRQLQGTRTRFWWLWTWACPPSWPAGKQVEVDARGRAGNCSVAVGKKPWLSGPPVRGSESPGRKMGVRSWTTDVKNGLTKAASGCWGFFFDRPI